MSVVMLFNGGVAIRCFYGAYKLAVEKCFNGWFLGHILFGVLNTICVFL